MGDRVSPDRLEAGHLTRGSTLIEGTVPTDGRAVGPIPSSSERDPVPGGRRLRVRGCTHPHVP